MNDLTDKTTVYIKTLKTIRLKISSEYLADPEAEPKKAESPDEVYEILKTIYRQLDDDQEHLVMLILNFSNEVVGYKVISSGGQGISNCDTKIVFRNALLLGAASIILAHNHPSGQKKPSREDVLLTERIVEAGKLMNIPLVDHLIFTHRGFCSMKADGYSEFEKQK